MDDVFDWMVYCTVNRDLWKANIRTRKKSINHWTKFGKNEDRLTSFPEFDWIYYVKNNPITKLDINNRLEALNHWFDAGIFEARVYSKDIPIKKSNISSIFNKDGKQKIYLVSHEDSNTGAPLFLLGLYHFIKAKGYDVQLISIRKIGRRSVKYFKYIHNTKLIDHILTDSLDNSKHKNMEGVIDRVKKYKTASTALFYKHNPIIFFNSLVTNRSIMDLSILSLPTYWIIHEWIDKNQPISLWIHNFSVFKYCTKIVYICEESRENFKKIKQSDSTIIYNSLSEEDIQKRIVPEVELKQSGDEIVITIVGTVDKRKNQENFINNVFSILSSKYSKVKLVLVGIVFIDQEKYEKLYGNSIMFVGNVSNSLAYINASDIIVSYSINEVFPLNLMEGMYCCKPIVSSNVGGIREMITDGEDGFLFDSNDSQACIDILENLLLNSRLRLDIGENGKKTLNSKFNMDIQYSKYLKLIDESYPDLEKAVKDTISSLLANPTQLISSPSPEIAVTLHLGNLDLWDEFSEAFKNFQDIHFDLWVNIPDMFSEEVITNIKSLIIDEYPKTYISVTPNKGFDIGGFLYKIKDMYRLNMKYKYILKLQTKSDSVWRGNTINSYIGSNDIINKNLELLTDSNTGMLSYSNRLISSDKEITTYEYTNNEYHIREICNFFYGDYSEKYSYSSGTMFWIRADIIYENITPCALEWLILHLNDKESYDWNWMNINRTTEIGNLLWKGTEDMIRDGMFEHALERFFGYMVTHSLYTIDPIQ